MSDAELRLRSAGESLRRRTEEVDVMEALSRVEVLAGGSAGREPWVAGPRRRTVVAALAVAAVMLLIAVASFVSGRRDAAPDPATRRGFLVSVKAPDRYVREFLSPLQHQWVPAESRPPTADRPFTILGVGRVTRELDVVSGRVVDVTSATLTDPVDDGISDVLAVRHLTVDGHPAVQFDVTGTRTVELAVAFYGEDTVTVSSDQTARVTRIAVGNQLYEVYGTVSTPLGLPAPGTPAAADYEAFLASVVVKDA